MYVCICRQVTDRDIHDAVAQGACRMRDLRDAARRECTVRQMRGLCARHSERSTRSVCKRSVPARHLMETVKE